MKKPRRILIITSLCLALLFGLFSGFSENNQNKSLSLYIKSWGILRYRIPKNKDECTQLDKAAYFGIESILKNSSKRNTNREIDKIVQTSLKFDLPNENQSELASDNNTQLQYFQNSWLENPRISRKNRSLLAKILNSKPSTTLFNINIPNNGKPLELTYCLSNIDEKSIEARIFGIGLLWNAVEFFFPYKDDIAQEWDTVLPEFLNRVIDCKTDISYQQLTMELIELLNDGHAHINSYELMQYWGFFSLPIQVGAINLDSLPIVTKVWNPNNLKEVFKLGDKIISINGISYKDYFTLNERYFSGGNFQAKRDKLYRTYVRTRSDKKLSVSIQRGSLKIKLEVIPIPLSLKNEADCFSIYCNEPVKLYGDSIAYLNLAKIEPHDFGEYYNLVASTKATIIDLRSYPTNILDTIANYYFSKPTTISNWVSPDYQFPGQYTPLQEEILGKENSSYYRGLIVLLVNNNTISRGEYIALALQALPNTVTIGTHTSGTDGDILRIDLPERLRAVFTTVRICYPGGIDTFRNGVKIDYELPNSDIYNTKHDSFINYSLKIIEKMWGQPSYPHEK